MSQKVEVLKNGKFSIVSVSEILEDYPFLKNENFDNVALLIDEYDIVFKKGGKMGTAIICWKRSTMTGKWTERVTFV